MEAETGNPIEPAGERLGAYRILHAIGRGGMGAVYLAVRDDDQYRKQVALKLVKPGMDTVDVLRRFRHERQILAGLEHPYIARLLDGGSTADGRPFLVMELVQGQPIGEYCRQLNLNIEARCRLFLKVCEAVSYAHRKLVVHRDLKPANILITAEGSPKLLDFGLAKILSASSDTASTVTPFAPLTPEYASPEQIRGGSLSTATDIYSLGVILHELLTGRTPHPVNSAPTGEWERAVCESDVPRPSSVLETRPDHERWRRKLQGDLDNIVMLALRKEADRRYRSVDEFASDIRNYLESRPVHARPDSLWYRTAKFARRRRFPLLAAACVLASLVGGMAIAIGQAHSAETARRLAMARQEESLRARQAAEREHRRAEKERDLAIAERRVADDRVTQMVDLSDRSLSQVYSLMERLAGGMPARRELIGTTLDFLEKLSTDAGSDTRLRIALAKAFTRLGDIQSDPSGVTMGGWDGSLKSYRAGSALLENLLQQPVPGHDGLLVWLDLQEKTGLLLGLMGRGAESPALLRRAIAVVERPAGGASPAKDLERRRGCLYLALAKEIHPDLAASRPIAETAIAILSALARQYPSDAELRYDLSRAHTERGYLIRNLETPANARADYEKTVELREQVAREHPTDVLYRRVLFGAYVHSATLAADMHQPDAERAYYQKALVLTEPDAADPQNFQAKGDYAFVLMTLTSLDEHPPDLAPSLALLRRAAALLEPMVADSSTSPFALTLAQVYDRVGWRLTQMGNPSEAIPQYRRARSLADAYLATYPNDTAAMHQIVDSSRALIRALAAAGERQSALDLAASLIHRVELSRDRGTDPSLLESSLAVAYLSLADAHRAFAEWKSARNAAREAIGHATAATRLFGRDAAANADLLAQARALMAECSSKLGTGD